MTYDPAALAVSLVALIVTVAIATRGWKRESEEREAAAQAEFFQLLVQTIRSQGLPAVRNGQQGESVAEVASLNAQAIGVLLSSKKSDEMMDMLVRVTTDAQKLGVECWRYITAIKDGDDTTKEYLEPVEFALQLMPVLLYQNLVHWYRDNDDASKRKSYAFFYATALLRYYEGSDD